MVDIRPTGRATEIAEVTPLTLGCGHAYQPGRVIVGYEPHPDYPGQRARSYGCRECGAVTLMEP